MLEIVYSNINEYLVNCIMFVSGIFFFDASVRFDFYKILPIKPKLIILIKHSLIIKIFL